MAWLVTVWKQKYHMSKPHLIPALPPNLDKANDVKFRRNMAAPTTGARAGACGLEVPRCHKDWETTSVSLHLRGKQCSFQFCIFSAQGPLAECKLGPSMWLDLARGEWISHYRQGACGQSCKENVLEFERTQYHTEQMIKYLILRLIWIL